MCVAHHYTQTNTNNVDKTCAPNKQLEVSTFIVLLDVTVQVSIVIVQQPLTYSSIRFW